LRHLRLTGFDARNLDQLDLPVLEQLTMTRMAAEGLPSMPGLLELEINDAGHPWPSELVEAPALREILIRGAEDVEWDAIPELADLERLTVYGGVDGDLGLDDLAFVRRLPNLQELSLYGNGSASDLSPLADLPLRSLDLDGLAVTSLEPIAGVASLEELSVRDASIRSLRPVASLTGLTQLRVSGPGITSLSGVETLAALEGLDVYDSAVRDLGPLADLTNLTSLGLDRSQVSDLTPLAGLSALTRLSLWGTPVTDIASLEGLPLISLDLNSSAVESVASLADTESLESLRIGSTAVTDLSPLRGLPNLTRLVPPEGSGADNRDEVVELLAS